MDTAPTVLKINGTKNDPQFTLYVGRECYMGGWSLPKSKWYNPYSVKAYGDKVCDMYKVYIEGKPELMSALPELANQKLGCWCYPKPCHASVLRDLYITHVVKD
jgi:hypothetical protein